MKKFILIFLLLNISNSFASEFTTNFTLEKFNEAQKNGKTVVVYSWNKYCGTCAKQKPILKQAKKDFTDILFLDYEQTKHKEIAKFLNINHWSTIAVYKNNNQINLGIGISKKKEIYSLIKEGI